MSIGTAVPSAEELAAVRHYFIHSRSVRETYTAGDYELEALDLIEGLFARGHEELVVAGGTGLYIDAIIRGFDRLPSADAALRRELDRRLAEEGLDGMARELKELDPVTYDEIDLSNPRRVLRALEVCLSSGMRFSELKRRDFRPRNFEVKILRLDRPREVLYDRIERRVDQMMSQGLTEEARALFPLRALPALRTVGYQELFGFFEGNCSLESAVEAIKLNTRHYAKRQLTWLRKYDAQVVSLG